MGAIETGIKGETLGTEGCGQFKCTDCFQKNIVASTPNRLAGKEPSRWQTGE